MYFEGYCGVANKIELFHKDDHCRSRKAFLLSGKTEQSRQNMFIMRVRSRSADRLIGSVVKFVRKSEGKKQIAKAKIYIDT